MQLVHVQLTESFQLAAESRDYLLRRHATP